eukprot:UC4_evm1s798
MFDSQNNNRGGYNKGDVDTSAAGGNINQQYDMVRCPDKSAAPSTLYTLSTLTPQPFVSSTHNCKKTCSFVAGTHPSFLLPYLCFLLYCPVPLHHTRAWVFKSVLPLHVHPVWRIIRSRAIKYMNSHPGLFNVPCWPSLCSFVFLSSLPRISVGKLKHFMGDKPIIKDKDNKEYAVHGGHAASTKILQSTGKSFLTIEWTNQHGCGGNEHTDPHKTNCNINIQYMCARQYQRSRARLDCDGRCVIKDVDHFNQVIERELDYDCSVETKPVSECLKDTSGASPDKCLEKCAGRGLTANGRLGMCEFKSQAFGDLKTQRANAFSNVDGLDVHRRGHEFVFWYPYPQQDVIQEGNCAYDTSLINAMKANLITQFGIEESKGESIKEMDIFCSNGQRPTKCSSSGIVCPSGSSVIDGWKPYEGMSRAGDYRRGAFFKVKTVAKWVQRDHYRHNCPHAACPNDSTKPCGSYGWGDTANRGADGPAGGISYRFRDGTTTNRQDFTNPGTTENEETRLARWITTNANEKQNRGLHESWEWYDECYRRERNRGLFTADQNLRRNNLGYSSAVYTRQNPNNNRRGYECPEERDYWPYWHPSPWRDIAVLTDRLDLCPYFQSESQNTKSKYWCRNTASNPRALRYNNEKQCIQQKGIWEKVNSHGLPPPECKQSSWSRVNHLGNGRFGQANTYNWSIPYDALADVYGVDLDGNLNGNEQNLKCVIRLRYNMTTDDYDGWKTDSNFNQNQKSGIKSPVQQNPEVNLGADMQALRLAINTAQFGRTFQDRSHVFQLVPRTSHPDDTTDTLNLKGVDIHNLNVRGKRCNIVQCFPSVEYDFVPNHLHIKEGDVVHFQWTGSNTHNNGNPAGDGQAGDAGEGTGGTDRHNVVEMIRDSKNSSFPATWEENTLFKGALWAAPIDDRIAGENELGTGVRRSSGRVDWKKSCGVSIETGEVSDAYQKLASKSSSGCGRPWKHDMAMAHGSANFYKQFPITQKISGNIESQTLDQVRAPSKTGELNNLLNNADAS